MDNNTIVVIVTIGAMALTHIVDSVTKAWVQRRRPRHESD